MGQPWTRVRAFIHEHVLGAAVTALVGAAAVGGATLLLRSCGDDSTIGDIRSGLVNEGYEIKAYHKLHIRPETESHLFAIQPFGDPLAAQEVRIYENGDKDARATFSPSFDHPARPSETPLGFAFEIAAKRDFGNDGLQEVIGSYTLEDVNATIRLPIAIAWDDGGKRYRMRFLLTRGFPVTNLALSMAQVPGGPALYLDPYEVHDRATGARFRSFSVQTLLVVPDGQGFDLVGTFPVSTPTADPQRIQVSGWFLSFKAGRPQLALACFMGRPRGFDLAVRSTPSQLAKYVLAAGPLEAKPESIARRTWQSALAQERRARSAAAAGGLYLGSVTAGSECVFGE